jgi:hypothetical protein
MDGMGRACGTHEGKINPKGFWKEKNPRPKHGWENTIKLVLKGIG